MIRIDRILLLNLIAFFAFAASAMPGKFLEVSPGIYRSEQPTVADMAELKQFGIKTILDLNDDEASIAEEKSAADSLGLIFISNAMSGFWTPSDEEVDASLAILRDPTNYPILLHCQHDEDRTGLIVGLHRVSAEGWTPEAAYDEMLERGFHRILFMLDRYFKSRTGL